MKQLKAIAIRGAEVGVLMATMTRYGFAQDCSPSGGAGIQQGAECAQPPGTPSDLFANFRSITNTLIFIVGAIAVLMLIIGGLRYVLSGGDSAGVKGAKDTILFAIIGIIVAILAFAIVNFVIVNINKAS